MVSGQTPRPDDGPQIPLYSLQAEDFLESDFQELLAHSPGPWPGSPSQATFLDTPDLLTLGRDLDLHGEESLTARLDSKVLPDFQSYPEPPQPLGDPRLQQTIQGADLHDPDVDRRAHAHPESPQVNCWDLTGQCRQCGRLGQKAVHAQPTWPQHALSPHMPLRRQSTDMLNCHWQQGYPADEIPNQQVLIGNVMSGQGQLHAVCSAAGHHTDVPTSQTKLITALQDAAPQKYSQGELCAFVLTTMAMLHDLLSA